MLLLLLLACDETGGGKGVFGLIEVIGDDALRRIVTDCHLTVFVELLIVLVTVVLKHQQMIQERKVQGMRRRLEKGRGERQGVGGEGACVKTGSGKLVLWG